jgi:hypothetical protein
MQIPRVLARIPTRTPYLFPTLCQFPCKLTSPSGSHHPFSLIVRCWLSAMIDTDAVSDLNSAENRSNVYQKM